MISFSLVVVLVFVGVRRRSGLCNCVLFVVCVRVCTLCACDFVLCRCLCTGFVM